MKKQQPKSVLDRIESETLDHYEQNALSFWEGTRDHDVTQNIEAFIAALPVTKPLNILDFGCGPGRDLMTFKLMGHNPIGLDGSKAFCLMAKKYSDCNTLNQQFLHLDLKAHKFDGIFANASLFHIPSQELVSVLKVLHHSLRPNGILFSSNPRGNQEGWSGQRYGHYMELEIFEYYLAQAGFKVLNHYYRPAGKPREQQPWLAVISQREEKIN
ncbi:MULTISPECIES: class I SAM-dependent methyltransferase [Colwellia]|uniref:Methyltransferase n=1 Tax=Colwellia marinimaniae TaxID=1513592 RepID=A0ABQ0MYK9_9GAMM|nr:MULTISPECIES: class I SAM-dependent methyltransferase [Colwellia]GAW97456.1 methyltransferase [Colwellia marinimaniae]